MTVYSFICRECGQRGESSSPERTHFHCGALMARDYSSIQLRGDAFTPHFNYATGQYVSNRREFEEALKRGSEVASLRVGMDHDFQPLYPGDVPEPTTDTDVLEVQARTWHDGVYRGDLDPDSSSQSQSPINLDEKGRSHATAL